MSGSPPSSACVRAHAKVNLFLEVLGRRPDGYHALSTVMQRISLHDHLRIERTDGAIELTVDGAARGVPSGPDNLAARAAAAALEALGCPGGVRIRLDKRIPNGAGLGGGSSDAAAALRVTAELYGGLPADRLHALASQLGSDVPFFLQEHAALCEGRGERIVETGPGPVWRGVLLCPAVHCATPTVYRAHVDDGTPPRDGGAAWRALQAAPADRLPGLLFNRLETAALAAYPELAELRHALAPDWPGLRLTGSGSSFVWIGEAPEPLPALPDGVRAVAISSC